MALVLAACSPTPLTVAASKPPEIVIGPRIIDQAGAYRNFIDRTTAISPNFTDGASVSSAVAIGSTIEPSQIMQGAIAYGAIVALEEPAFVAGVRAQAIGDVQRAQLAESLTANPYNVLAIRGSGEAANRVTLHPERRDRWGLPIAHIACRFGDNEHRMLFHMHQRMEEVVAAAGGRIRPIEDLFVLPLLERGQLWPGALV